jgi:thiamine-monophosphate kinase
VDEIARIAMLAKLLGHRKNAEGVEVGIGDDAAVLTVRPGEGKEEKLVWTIDEQVEGTHFRRDLLSWRDVGWRSFMAAVSDVAAMGAVPWGVLSAMVLPADVDDAALEAIARGQDEASEAVGAPVVGGNLARGPVFSIATTVLGRAVTPVLRGGAKAGDGLWMAGSVGLAAAGFRALSAGKGSDPRMGAAVRAWRAPRALIHEGRAMSAVAHAAIDVSDGLARDAGHIAASSRVGIVLDAEAIAQDAALREVAAALVVDPLELALHGGEDYALVASSAEPIAGFQRIGDVVAGEGLRLRTRAGEVPLEPKGFDHFRSG